MTTIFHWPFSKYRYMYSKGENIRFALGMTKFIPKGFYKVRKSWKTDDFLEIVPLFDKK